MAAPISLEEVSLDMGGTATGGTFGNIDGPNYGGGSKGWLNGTDQPMTPGVSSYLAPGLAVVALVGVALIWARGR